MISASLKKLSTAYQSFQKDKDIEKLLAAVEDISQADQESTDRERPIVHPLTPVDLYLMSREYVCS